MRIRMLDAQPDKQSTTINHRTRCCDTRIASRVCGISLMPNSKGGFSGCHCKGRQLNKGASCNQATRARSPALDASSWLRSAACDQI